jgi:spermidine/putrescine transport system ATP-binding protein
MQLELKRIQTEVGITFIYVTHDQDEAMTLSDSIAVMRAGRIEQLGPPEVLYERPATEFVAGFLGISNLLNGRVVGSEGGGAEIQLDGGVVVRAWAVTNAVGSQVRIGVRPEKLRVEQLSDSDEPNETPGANELRGIVTDASYVGVSTQYVIRLEQGQDVVVYTQNLETSGIAEQRRTGQRVRLTWLPKHTFVIDGPSSSIEGAAIVTADDTVEGVTPGGTDA